MISVCMATYNGARFIKEQIDSILCQLGSEDELIISDDGSTDGTLDIIASYEDERIKLLHHQKNPAFAKIKYSRNFYYATENFENALREAKGDYIFLSDQDDVWLPNKMEKMIAALKTADCAMSNFNVIDANGNLLKEHFYKKAPISRFFFVALLQYRFIGCCMAFRRAVLDFSLPFPSFLLAHDFWIGILAKKKFSFAFIEEPLLNYRRSSQNVSPSTEKSRNPISHRVCYRAKSALLVAKRCLKK